MSESSKPFAEIMIGTEICPVTRDNLSLYRHLGANAVYDHCFIKGPSDYGVFIWAFNPDFELYAQLAEEHHAYTVLNKTAPSDNDRSQYITRASEDLEDADEFAKRWVEEQAEL